MVDSRSSPQVAARLPMVLLALDVVGFVFAFNLSYKYAIAEWLGFVYLPLAGILVLQLAALYVLALYTINEYTTQFDVLARTVFGVVSAGLLTAGIVYITESRDTEPLFFRGVLPGGFVLFLIWAAVMRSIATALATRLAKRIRWLVVSDLTPDSPLCNDVAAIGEVGDMVLLVDDPRRAEQLPETVRKSVYGGFDTLWTEDEKQWSGIVIASQGALPEDLLRQVMEMRLRGVRIYDLTDFYEQFLQKIPVMHLQDNWFALSHGFDLLHHDIELKIKRLLDIFVSAMLLTLSLPVMVVIALAIKLDRREYADGPILYRQLRTGANGSEFSICKFRTMVNDAETNGAQWAEQNDNRITRVGRVLRRWRLDELPQLWNVVKGEMSFIGPRPERPDFNRELEKAIPYYDLRHLVKPGITGWAQVKYDYGSSVEDALEKLQYDIYYIKNYTLRLDLFIVLKTFRVIMSRRGR